MEALIIVAALAWAWAQSQSAAAKPASPVSNPITSSPAAAPGPTTGVPAKVQPTPAPILGIPNQTMWSVVSGVTTQPNMGSSAPTSSTGGGSTSQTGPLQIGGGGGNPVAVPISTQKPVGGGGGGNPVAVPISTQKPVGAGGGGNPVAVPINDPMPIGAGAGNPGGISMPPVQSSSVPVGGGNTSPPLSTGQSPGVQFVPAAVDPSVPLISSLQTTGVQAWSVPANPAPSPTFPVYDNLSGAVVGTGVVNTAAQTVTINVPGQGVSTHDLDPTLVGNVIVVPSPDQTTEVTAILPAQSVPPIQNPPVVAPPAMPVVAPPAMPRFAPPAMPVVAPPSVRPDQSYLWEDYS